MCKSIQSTIVVLWLDLKNRVLLLKDKQEIRKFNFIVLLATTVLCHKHSTEKEKNKWQSFGNSQVSNNLKF